MKRTPLYTLLAVLLMAAFVLVACQPAAPEATDAPPEPTEVVVEPTEEVVEPTEEVVEPTEEVVEPTEEPAAFEGMTLAAESCDYGGKISSVEAVDALTVVFTMCNPDPAFLSKIAFTPFGIYSSDWIMANANAENQETLLSAPVGTGPWMLSEWNRGDSLVFTRFEDYWGDQPVYDTLVFRWATESAARLLELQSGTVHHITSLSPDEFEVVQADPNLVFLPDPNPNTYYLGMTNTFSPFSNLKFRQGVAMGIDRQRIVDNYYPPGAETASHFTPCSIPNGCVGDEWYGFDPVAGRALVEEALAEEGIALPFTTSIFYRDVFRVYLPNPSLVAVELQTQLSENLGIEAEVVVMESGEFIGAAFAGELNGFFQLGWGADYPHVTNFLDFHFGFSNPEFGTPHEAIYALLEEVSRIVDPATAEPLYTQANNAIRELVPVVPIAHGVSADAALASLEGAYLPVFGAVRFSILNPGADTLVFMQNAEPISLYCADESDGESLAACQQFQEKLYRYQTDSGDVEPELATACTSNEDATVWTCTLREGVLFHDGSTFDANDVVMSFTAGLDAASPYHIGNTGGFEYYGTLWDRLMNVPAEE